MRDLVQSIGLPRQIGVVDDVRLLPVQFVRFDDKAADVPRDSLNGDITDDSRQDRHDQPAPPRHSGGIDCCNHRAKSERCADDQHPGDRDVRVRVGHTSKDRMILEQALKPAEIREHREDQQQKRKRDRQPAPR